MPFQSSSLDPRARWREASTAWRQERVMLCLSLVAETFSNISCWEEKIIYTNNSCQRKRSSSTSEHHGLLGIHNHAVFQMVTHSPCQNAPLDIAAFAHQVVRRVI